MRIVTFNSFPGSPLPFIRNGTLGIGQNSRLARQLKALRGMGSYEFGCFQEIFSRKAVAEYIKHHRRLGMDVVATDQSDLGGNHFHRSLGLTLGVLFMSCSYFMSPLSYLTSSVLLVALAVVSFWITFTLEECAAFAFSIMSANRSGLMTFYKAHRYHLVRSHTLRLPNQSEDMMNLLQPRLALITLFWDTHTRKQIVVVNTHLNALGSDRARLEQLDYITYYLKTDEEFKHFETYVCGDMNQDLTGVSGRLVTWDPGVNPLCNGWMRNMQACQIDYIMPINPTTNNQHHIHLSTHHMDFTSDHYLVMLEKAD
jgi:endonuclease/exonuclease/phosphatase family metal-dependent hydrolase